MGDILPDGSIQGHSKYCSRCGKTILANIQGDEMGSHECFMNQCLIQDSCKSFKTERCHAECKLYV